MLIEIRQCRVCNTRMMIRPSDGAIFVNPPPDLAQEFRHVYIVCTPCGAELQAREQLYRDMVAREESHFLNGAALDALRFNLRDHQWSRRPARMQISPRDPVFRTAYPATFVPSDAEMHAELNALERASNWTPAVPPLGPYYGD